MYPKILNILPELTTLHGFWDSVLWWLSPHGILVDGKIDVWGCPPATVQRVWSAYSPHILRWAVGYTVPAELIVATICTESGGDSSSIREEPGFKTDQETPGSVSVGLMQTLISTARDATKFHFIDRAWLLIPENSIQAGTSMIAHQFPATHFDPPKVACAYNAGGIYHQEGLKNRWKMRQFPIGTGEHADRFVKWFNECFIMFKEDHNAPEMSFYKTLQERTS